MQIAEFTYKQLQAYYQINSEQLQNRCHIYQVKIENNNGEMHKIST